MEKFKPLIYEIIQYYYSIGNGTGGYLHTVLDDGNVEHDNIFCCQEECLKNGDSLGVFVCDVLLEFNEDELSDFFQIDYWGML